MNPSGQAVQVLLQVDLLRGIQIGLQELGSAGDAPIEIHRAERGKGYSYFRDLPAVALAQFLGGPARSEGIARSKGLPPCRTFVARSISPHTGSPHLASSGKLQH